MDGRVLLSQLINQKSVNDLVDSFGLLTKTIYDAIAESKTKANAEIKQKKNINDADRLRKYLARFNLQWQDIKNTTEDK